MKEKGLILLNTGSPEALSTGATRKFIGDMLSDPYVMGMPAFVRIPLARGIIAPLRASASFQRYKKIWGEQEQSPLLYHTQQLARNVETKTGWPTTVCMRYGTPDFQDALHALKKKHPHINEIIVLPLFPQFANSSYHTAVESIEKQINRSSESFTFRFIPPFYNHPAYIKTLSEHLKAYLPDAFDRLVFTFHSLPLNHINQGRRKGSDYDYEYQCKETIRLLTEKLQLPPEKYTLTYTSPFGKKWLEPFLNQSVSEMPTRGIKKIAVFSPGFLIDNLETLYDINQNARSLFLEKGGDSFTYIPCLNKSFDQAIKFFVDENSDEE